MANLSRKDTVVIFGGTGFLGRYLIRNLLESGAKIKVASLHNTPPADITNHEQVSFWQCDIKNKESVFNIAKGATHIVNLVGLRFETGDNNFENAHVIGASNIATAAKELGANRLLHLSVLTNNTNSRYGETKLRAQKEVLSIFPKATVVRPSLVYGREGKFVNLYAKVVKKALFVPLLWGGQTKTQALYVEDVGLFLAKALQGDDEMVLGKVLNIAGPKVYRMLDILNFVMQHLQKKRVIIPLPGWAGYTLGYICEKFGIKFMSRDLVRLMKEDFILREGEHNSMPDFGVKPVLIEEIVPTYLK